MDTRLMHGAWAKVYCKIYLALGTRDTLAITVGFWSFHRALVAFTREKTFLKCISKDKYIYICGIFFSLFYYNLFYLNSIS